MVVEIKPKRQVEQNQIMNPKEKDTGMAKLCQDLDAVNQAKWKAAKEFCADRNYEFKIMTEDDLGIK